MREEEGWGVGEWGGEGVKEEDRFRNHLLWYCLYVSTIM